MAEERRVVRAFRVQIGMDTLPTPAPDEGVRYDWRDLIKDVAPETRGFKAGAPWIVLLAPGLMQGGWTWKRAGQALYLEIVVSGQGPEPAREHLITLASTSSRHPIPWAREPGGPGDLAVYSTTGTPPSSIMWVYRNVSANLYSVDGGEPAVEPLARAVQRVMERHLVAKVSTYLPRPDRVEISPRRVALGDKVAVTIRGALPQAVICEIRPKDARYLRLVSQTATAAVLEARAPGTAGIAVRIGDEDTLLSPFYDFSVDILPATNP
jgi:hypothetical protein